MVVGLLGKECNMEIKLSNGIKIGDGHPTFIIAEIGNNHNGNMDLAKQLVDKAVNAKADAVKFQTKDIETSFSKELLDSSYVTPNSFGNTYREHKQALEFNKIQHHEIFEYSKRRNILAFSTPFDLKSLELLEELDVSLYKLSSFHVTDLKLIDAVADTGKPIIMSTGMSTIAEIDVAVDRILKKNDRLILLHCVSSYPTEDRDVNLRNIIMLRERYKTLVGYSGHERGITICTASIPLGACVIERHFTLDRTMKGPDHAASIEPHGLELIVKHARQIEAALGSLNRNVLDAELKNRKKFRGY